jgi:hypothetical protein
VPSTLMFMHRATDAGFRSRNGSSGHMPAAVTLFTRLA